MSSVTVSTRPGVEADSAWIAETLVAGWGSTRLATHGELLDGTQLPSIVAESDGERVGLLTWYERGSELEVVTLQALRESRGVGQALMQAAFALARGRGSTRLYLLTTNENERAIAFYRRLGMELVRVHVGAVTEARKLKPEIPALSADGVPIEDELEFELSLERG